MRRNTSPLRHRKMLSFLVIALPINPRWKASSVFFGRARLTHDRGVFAFIFCVEVRREGCHASLSFEWPRLFALYREKYAVGPRSDEENIVGLFCFYDVEEIFRYLAAV